jgi:peptidylprolyl isomerase
MSTAKPGDKVKVHYTGRLDDGSVFDSSLQREPLEFTIGQQRLIPGFEEAVAGMNPGETKSTTIPADQAYGPRRDEMVLVVERQQLPENVQPAVGQQLQIQPPDGQPIQARIVDVSPSAVTLDANHPLAGQDLTFDLQLVEIV